MTNTNPIEIPEADETAKIELPANGRQTLRDQGLSLREVTAPEPDLDDLDDLDDPEADDEPETDDDVLAPVGIMANAPDVAEEGEPEKPPALPREEMLDQASEILARREREYGPAESDLGRIATILSVILHHEVTIDQANLILAGISMARLSANPTKAGDWEKFTASGALGGELAERTR